MNLEMRTQTRPAPAAGKTAKFSVKYILTVVGFVLVGAAVGYVIAGGVKTTGGKAHVSLWMLALIPPAGLLAIALHEAGHVAGGLMSGFRFYLYVAGPLRIERNGERLRFGFNSVGILWGGLAACIPKRVGPEIRGGMLRFTAGGPVASLLLVLVLLPASAMRAAHPDLAYLLGSFALMSGGVGLVTLVPMQVGGFTNDGSRLLMLVRDRAEGRRWTAMGAVAGLSMVERPKRWPVELVELLGNGQDAAADSGLVCLLRHSWHLDRRELEAGGMWIDRAVDKIEVMAKPMRGSIYAAATSFCALHRADARIAREYLDKALETTWYDHGALHTVNAAVLIAEGRSEEGRRELDLAAGRVESKPPQLAEALREEIDELRARIG